MIDALHHAGSTPLHRLPAGAKVGTLAAAAVLVFAVSDLRVLVLLLALVVGGYAVARVPVRLVLQQLRLAAVAFAFLLVLHLVFGDLAAGVVPALRLAILMLLSTLVTLTTRTTEMVDLVVWLARPLRHVGIDPERVGLLLALAIRFVPVVATLARDVREAQRARGAERDLRAFAVPLLVRALRMADDLGDAIDARGGGATPAAPRPGGRRGSRRDRR